MDGSLGILSLGPRSCSPLGDFLGSLAYVSSAPFTWPFYVVCQSRVARSLREWLRPLRVLNQKHPSVLKVEPQNLYCNTSAESRWVMQVTGTAQGEGAAQSMNPGK